MPRAATATMAGDDEFLVSRPVFATLGEIRPPIAMSRAPDSEVMVGAARYDRFLTSRGQRVDIEVGKMRVAELAGRISGEGEAGGSQRRCRIRLPRRPPRPRRRPAEIWQPVDRRDCPPAERASGDGSRSAVVVRAVGGDLGGGRLIDLARAGLARALSLARSGRTAASAAARNGARGCFVSAGGQFVPGGSAAGAPARSRAAIRALAWPSP